MDMYRCLEHGAGAFFLCCLCPGHDYSSVRNMTFTKSKSSPPKSLIPSPSNMLIYAKHIEIISLSTLWCLDLKDCEGATAAHSVPFSMSLELKMDFWNCIKYHMVLMVVEKSSAFLSASLCLLPLHCGFIWDFFHLLAFYLHLFLFLFLLICPQQFTLWCA